MAALGIHLLSGQFRYAYLAGGRNAPVLEGNGRLVTPTESNVPALMDWYDSQFRLLVERHEPEVISYRLTLGAKKKQLFTSIFPLGLLNFIAHEKGLRVSVYTAQSFTATRLGLGKAVDVYAHCDSVLGKHPPYWDKNQKNAILAAWFELS